jgi:hypothetical protein
MRKREHHFARIEEYKERFRRFSTEYLVTQLPKMTIKEAAVAARAVLKERGYQPVDSN